MANSTRWNKPAVILSPKQKEKRFREVYALEIAKKYQGDEEFMNTMHPFEASGRYTGKKSSPIQKAIIACINLYGGSASEEQLLQYVKKKWDIIVKYSEREFSTEPSIRVIRLNCAVKKKARHLFLKDPVKHDNWILNSSLRKTSCKMKRNEESSNDETDAAILCDDDCSDYSSESQDEECRVMKKDTFEACVETYVRGIEGKVSFDEICCEMKKYENMRGIFETLSFARRVRACLIVFKSENMICHDSNDDKWFRPCCMNEKTSLDNFYKSVLKKRFV